VPFELVIERVFDAPRDLVWRAWTDPEQLAQWWGPKGMQVTVKSMDLRPGGIFLYKMFHPNGQVMWGRFVFQEITPPERLVFINAFTDAEGRVIRSPMSPTWPMEILNILTFTETSGKTTLILRGGPYNSTDLERKTFETAQANVKTGFAGTLDRLAKHLTEL
jgi:uncharacterized protein YndB with AHSA1/START domain